MANNLQDDFIDSMALRYAPAKDDPSNKNWPINVKKIFKQEMETRNA